MYYSKFTFLLDSHKKSSL
uniref:Uncharacterized protein n=1 Tax=Rhizophora mucronata TaxID=61149 RepID=A0A2P2NKI2_RHIMU